MSHIWTLDRGVGRMYDWGGRTRMIKLLKDLTLLVMGGAVILLLCPLMLMQCLLERGTMHGAGCYCHECESKARMRG